MKVRCLLKRLQGFFDGGAVETDYLDVADFSDGNRSDVVVFGRIDLFIFIAEAIEPVHESMTICTSRGSIDSNHDIIIAWK